jgi:two-component system nitrate/nitrite response regulator NarL
MSGIEAAPRVLEAAPDVSLLMLTIAMEEDRVLAAVRAGACGYLLKDAELSEIAAGIRAAAEGLSAIAPGVAGAILASVRRSGEAQRNGWDQAPSGLSSREHEVLQLVSRGCENAEIARRLVVSPSTVKHHISSLPWWSPSPVHS